MKDKYIRTADGYIGKIIEESWVSDFEVTTEGIKRPKRINVYIMDTYHCFSDGPDLIDYDEVVKSSPNILELLEPMDLLYMDISPDNCLGIVVPRIPETLNELEGFVEFIKSGHCILKGVVTHEQLKKLMYKVGE